MTLRDASQKNAKPEGEVFPAADKAAVPSRLSSGTELRSRGISEHLPAVCWAGAGLPGVVAAHTASPSTPNKVMRVLFKESGAATPHIQEHLQSLANCLLANLRYLYFMKLGLSDVWGIFPCLIKRMRVLNK